MANVGTGAAGKTLIGAGNGASPTFASIGTNSGLTAHGVVLAEGNGAFVATGTGSTGQVLTSNGASSDATFQSVSAAGAVTTITGNSGGAQSPSAGNFNVVGAGSITSVGTANTETVQLTGLTSHSVLIGAGTATITKIAPSSTPGIALVSNGTTLDPSFTTVLAAGGGTGRTTLTAHALLIGNGTGQVTPLSAGAANTILRSVSPSSDPVYTTHFTVDSSDIYTNTSQPACNVWLFNSVTNVTGDGTLYVPLLDQTVVNAGVLYNTATGIYSVAVAGAYYIDITLTLTGIGVGHTSGSIIFDTSGGASIPVQTTFAPFATSVSGVCTFSCSLLTQLPALGTITPSVVVSGSTKTVGVQGAIAGRATSFINAFKFS